MSSRDDAPEGLLREKVPSASLCAVSGEEQAEDTTQPMWCPVQQGLGGVVLQGTTFEV